MDQSKETPAGPTKIYAGRVRPFFWIALDIVVPLPKSSAGHEFILVLIDYATWFPDAILLCSVIKLK